MGRRRGAGEKIEAAGRMRNRVERLRVWLLGSAIFLMLVIAAFIVSARYLARLHKLVLPAKLGIDVKGDASGYTVSRMVGLKTIFTPVSYTHLDVYKRQKDRFGNGGVFV